MFRILLAHPQEAINKRHLIYCVRVMSVGCSRFRMERSSTPNLVQYPSSAFEAPPENEQVMLETCRDP
jgi:hypothetical protein